MDVYEQKLVHFLLNCSGQTIKVVGGARVTCFV